MPDVNKVYQALRRAVDGENIKTVVIEAAYLAGEKLADIAPEHRGAAKELAIKCMEEALNDTLMGEECEGEA